MGWQDGVARRRKSQDALARLVISTRAKSLLLFAAVVAAAITLHRFSPVSWPPLAVDILHSLHGTGFAVLALAIFSYLQYTFPNSINYLLAAVITMGIGVVSEAAQIPGPRDAQISDLVADGLGIFGGLGVRAAFDADVRVQLRGTLRMLLPALSGVALAIACMPSIWLSYAIVQQHRALPEILTFEHAWERATYGQTVDARPVVVQAPAGWPVKGKKIGRATEDGRWGIFISVHPRQDWRGYSSLSFIAASAGEAFSLDIGVRDMRKADEDHGIRHYKSVVVNPQPKRYTVTFEEIAATATDRPFDLSLVEAIVLSAVKPGSGGEILVDDFRLEL